MTKQLFTNEMEVIAGLTGHYNKKMQEIQSGKAALVPNPTSNNSKVKRRLHSSPPPIFRHPIYLNNPNFVKKKRLVITRDCQS